LEIISERLRRDYGQEVVCSDPSVALRVKIRGAKEVSVFSARHLPESHAIEYIKEPWVRGEAIIPSSFLGGLTRLVNEVGGKMGEAATMAAERLRVYFEAPLRAVIVDFYEKLKSVSGGFASCSYQIFDYRPADVVRVDFLVGGEKFLELSQILPRKDALARARARVKRLKEVLPHQLFSLALQAQVEGRIIARETLPALKKDVTGYLYGGDRTRKMKLWKKQQRGKKRLRARPRRF
jgi:GTP-binding protein LepA